MKYSTFAVFHIQKLAGKISQFTYCLAGVMKKETDISRLGGGGIRL